MKFADALFYMLLFFDKNIHLSFAINQGEFESIRENVRGKANNGDEERNSFLIKQAKKEKSG